MVQPVRRAKCRVAFKKLKVELPYDLEFHSWTYIWKKSNSKGYMNPNVHCNTIYNNQDKETT